MRRSAVVLGLCFSLLASCKSDPSKPEYWDQRLGDAKGKKEKLKVLEELRGSKFRTAAVLPVLHKHLQSEKSLEVRAAVAHLVALQQDPSSLEPLVNAIEPAPADAEARALNKALASALGALGDPKAGPGLLRLLKTRDAFTTVAAIEGLARLKTPEAYQPLSDLAGDDAVDPFLIRKALEALGDLGDPRAVPLLVKAMFRGAGAGYYRESSFALYQLGQPSADALVPVVAGADASLQAWADKAGIKKVALLAKATQVLGDLHEPKAVKPIVGLLAYRTEYDDECFILRTRAADALGRMRAREAVKPLAGLLDDPLPDARLEYALALARIGGTEAVPRLTATASKGVWSAREESLKGLAMLGDEPTVFEGLAQVEASRMKRECAEDDGAEGCDDVPRATARHVDRIRALALRAAAARECRGLAGCWVKKLDDPDAGVRERAALELGRSGQAAVVGALLGHLGEQHPEARVAVIQAVDWLTHDAAPAREEARKAVPAIAQQLEAERGKSDFQKVNEDLRRLEAWLSR